MAEQLDLDLMDFPEEIYPRSHVDWRTVARYHDDMIGGVVFPPISVVADNGRYIVIDGWHRCQATQRAGISEISAEVLDLPKSEWYVEAVRRNNQHGKSLNYWERITIAARLEGEGKSPTEIAQILSASQQFAMSVSARSIARQGPDGVINIALKPALLQIRDQLESQISTTAELENLVEIQKYMSGQKQLGMVRQVVDLLENDLIDTESTGMPDMLERLRNNV